MVEFGAGGGGDNYDILTDYLMEQGALQPELQGIERRRAMIDQLRGASQVPTETRNAGRLTVARSPLEMLAPVLGQGLAAYKEKGVDADAAALQQKKLAGISSVRDRMYGKKKGGAFPVRPMPGEDTQPL